MIRKFLIAALALIPSFGAIAQTEIAKGDVNLMVVSDLGRNPPATMTRSLLLRQWAELQSK